MLLAGCTNHFGFGLSGLAADAGWQPLPIQAWVLNEGIEPRAIVYCPRDVCARPGVAALFGLDGRRADELEAALAADPGELVRHFTRQSKKAPIGAPKSMTHIERVTAGGAPGLLVRIAARDGGKQAWSAILHRRDGPRLALAFAVSPEAETALAQARAALDSDR